MSCDNSGVIYILTNPVMPGLIKIGKTGNHTKERMSALYSTGVPVPFECEFAGRVANMDVAEKAFHEAFEPYRVNPKREFFEMEAYRAVVLLQAMALADVTPEVRESVDQEVDAQSQAALQRVKNKRPPMNFTDMDIPNGSELVFKEDHDIKVIVSSSKKVRRGESEPEQSLTSITRELLGNDYDVAPKGYWTYQGKYLTEFYNNSYAHTT